MAGLIGIDIGSCLVKVVWLEGINKYALRDCFSFAIPYIKGSVKIDGAAVFSRITQHIPLKQLKSCEVAINIPSSRTVVLVVDLPKMNRRELEVAAVAEARRRMVPTPGPDSIFEYLLLGEVMVGKIPRYEVLVIKTDKDCIQDTIDIFQYFPGISPVLVSPACYTITNIFPYDSRYQSQDIGFINIGYESIDVTIARRGKLSFYRNIKFGLKDVITHMSGPLNLKPSVVAEVIREKGVPHVSIDVNDKVKVAEEIMRQKYEASNAVEGKAGVNTLELRMLWGTEIDRMVSEIRRTLIYYRDQTKGGRVNKLFILGGGAAIGGLASALGTYLGDYEIMSFAAGAGITVAEDKKQIIAESAGLFTPAASIAVSIPLVRKKKEAIDFLPENIKQERAVFQRQISIIIIAIIVLSLSFLSWLKVFIDNKLLAGSISRLNLEFERSEKVIEMLKEKSRQRRDIDVRLAEVNAIVDARLDLYSFLDELSFLVPERVTLKSVLVYEKPRIVDNSKKRRRNKKIKKTDSNFKKNYLISIEAFCSQDYQSAVRIAGEFSDNLKRSPYFSNVGIDLPVLETMVPYMSGRSEVALTQVQLRAFKIGAELIRQDEP